MKNRNKHTQYRKSIYRKRNIKTTVIIFVSVLVILFALLLIVGTVLYNKTKPSENKENSTEDTLAEDNPLFAAPSIKAYALPLLESSSNFSSRLNAVNDDAGAVCINLNTSDGVINYTSNIASKVSSFNIAPYASSLSNALDGINAKGFYTSALIYLTALSGDNDLLEEVELSVYASLACEAIREGVGDILFLMPSFDADDADKLCMFADRIHLIEKNAIIGIAISSEMLNDENSTLLIDTLNKHFNYLCLDVSNYGDRDALEYVEEEIADNQGDLMYYNMRALLPFSSDKELQEKYIEAAEKNYINNWQILP